MRERLDTVSIEYARLGPEKPRWPPNRRAPLLFREQGQELAEFSFFGSNRMRTRPSRQRQPRSSLHAAGRLFPSVALRCARCAKMPKMPLASEGGCARATAVFFHLPLSERRGSMPRPESFAPRVACDFARGPSRAERPRLFLRGIRDRTTTDRVTNISSNKRLARTMFPPEGNIRRPHEGSNMATTKHAGVFSGFSTGSPLAGCSRRDRPRSPARGLRSARTGT